MLSLFFKSMIIEVCVFRALCLLSSINDKWPVKCSAASVFTTVFTGEIGHGSGLTCSLHGTYDS